MPPVTVQEAIQIALQHHQAGRLADAEQIYRQVLAVEPRHADALHFLGVVASQTGRNELAAEMIRKAIAEVPAFPVWHSNLAEVYRKLGRVEEAIAAGREALRLEPGLAAAHSNLGLALTDRGHFDEAAAAFRRAVEIDPGIAAAHYNLGNVLKDQGRFTDAIAAYRRALQLDPGNADVHNNLGETLKNRGDLEEAAAAFRRGMELNPRDAEVHSNLVLLLHYLPGCDAASIFREHREWDRIHARSLRDSIGPHRNDPDPERRLRIGYVSPDFRQHSVAYFLEGLLEAHDRSQVEVSCYADLRRGDEFTARLRGHAAHWRTIAGMRDEDVAALIRGDGIDILVDLAGHTAHNRLLVFARKPAPVQITYLGYCGTTGMETMDFRFTDAHADPPGATEHLHAEKLVRLPGTFACFRPHEAAPEVGPLPAATRGHVTFASFHTLTKLNDPLLEWWASILHRVPDSRLLMVAAGLDDPSIQQRYTGLFARRGVSPSRLDFRGRQKVAQYLALHGEADVLLDSHPFSAHTVSCHALWMGVPVVTLAGTTHCSRMVTSVLTNLGHPEWIAGTPQEYVNIATALVSDLAALAEIRASLRGRMSSSPLTDAPRFARHVEHAFRETWREWTRRTREPGGP